MSRPIKNYVTNAPSNVKKLNQKDSNVPLPESAAKQTDIPSKIQIYLTILTTGVALFIAIFNWAFTENVRTNLQAQTTELQRQTVALDRTKTDLAKLAQESEANNVKINAARLALEKIIAQNNLKNETEQTLIDKKNSRTTEAGLAQQYTSLLTGLRPNISSSCSYSIQAAANVKIICTLINHGQYTVQINSMHAEPVASATGDSLANIIVSQDRPQSNRILPNGTATNTYHINLISNAIYATEMQFKISWTATINQDDRSVVVKMASGYITNKQAVEMSSQNYNFYLDVEPRAPY